MLKRGDKGALVREVQEALMEIGYPLPKWGADGDLGSETLDAFELFISTHGRGLSDKDKSTISRAEYDLLKSVLSNTRSPSVVPAELYDLRKTSSKDCIQRRRTWKEVDSVVLHQTAAFLGETPKRYNTLAAHIGITRKAKTLWVHDFDWNVAHANLLNTTSVGIEFDGYYEGIEGNIRTFWRPKDDPKRMPMLPTAEAVEAGIVAIGWICDRVAQHGGKIKYLYAHRQSSRNRQSDPGSGWWQRVALPAMQRYKLSDRGPGYRVGTGYAIPEAWDPSRKGIKY